MTEYELSEVVIGYSSNVDQSTAVMISVMSAYLITAYTIGRNLSRFQVIFISVCFFMVFVGLLNGQWFYVSEILSSYDQLRSTRSGESALYQSFGSSTVVMFFVVRILFLLGSLYFMWNVRHRRTL